MKKIRVIVADSQPGMRRLLGRRLAASACIELAGLVADERGLVQALSQGVCDVVALRFPLGTGNDARSGSYARLGARLAALGRQRVVAIANIADRAGVLQLIKDGCRNVVTGRDHADEVLKAVRMAHLDLASVSEVACDLIWGRRCRGLGDFDDWAELLTTRESEVLRLYLSGLSVTEIAVRTGRTVKTISTQKQSVMRKVGADNDVELAAFAIQRGML